VGVCGRSATEGKRSGEATWRLSRTGYLLWIGNAGLWGSAGHVRSPGGATIVSGGRASMGPLSASAPTLPASPSIGPLGRVQVVVLPDGGRTWTVLGADYLPVPVVEGFLEHQRQIGSSPNTVKSYARGLGLWWRQFEACGEDWQRPRASAATSFVTYVLHPEGIRGVEGLTEMVERYRSAISGLTVEIEHQFTEGDYVASRYTIHGTHTGELMGAPASGNDVAFSGITVSRCRDGKLVEEWEITDTLGLLRQVGALP
jgi:predicted ester cyclase